MNFYISKSDLANRSLILYWFRIRINTKLHGSLLIMKHFTSALAVATSLLVSTTYAAPSWGGNGGKKPSSVPSADGTVFNINGKPQYFAGTNSWWLGHLTSDTDVDLAASEISSSGLKVSRVWAFGNANQPSDQTIYYQLLDNVTNTISINYNATSGIPRLDSAIKHAEKYNLKLVLPMLNNWNDLGGINTYCNYFGCNATTFFTNTAAQAAYKNYIKFIVNRYKSSPAIFSWELCNEPRCHGCDSSVITTWASETSAYIKSLDPTHMVTLGDEGWFCSGGDGSYAYSCAEGVDFEKNLQVSTLDYGTFHQYPDQWGYNYTWGNEWIQQHAALSTQYKKPVVLEEYGVQDDAYNTNNRTSTMRMYQETVTASQIAYDGNWQFGTVFPDGEKPFDDYTSYYGTAYFNETELVHVAEMAAKKVA